MNKSMFHRVIHPCDVPQWDGKKWPMFCKVSIVDGKLSISGVVGPNHYGGAKGGCGQIDMEFDHADKSENDPRYSEPVKASALRFAPGWNRARWHKFLHIWHRWHLNDMRAGCEHQRALGWTYEAHHDPDTFKGEACPTCGYEIGSAWLREELPQDVIDFLEGLPETDRTPAWV